jgi:hypothetical protein
MADEAASWTDLHGRFDMSRIDHSALYSEGKGIYTNGAEQFFSRISSCRIGPLSPHRRIDNGTQVKAVATLAMGSKTSVDW